MLLRALANSSSADARGPPLGRAASDKLGRLRVAARGRIRRLRMLDHPEYTQRYAPLAMHTGRRLRNRLRRLARALGADSGPPSGLFRAPSCWPNPCSVELRLLSSTLRWFPRKIAGPSSSADPACPTSRLALGRVVPCSMRRIERRSGILDRWGRGLAARLIELSECRADSLEVWRERLDLHEFRGAWGADAASRVRSSGREHDRAPGAQCWARSGAEPEPKRSFCSLRSRSTTRPTGSSMSS